ncbi:hypothetical protein BIV57_01350 [Mangrovactinospora gilvigrisea]|uniref:DUF4349 domain-containing protein n=1 Tax=Mangrovactinospora gilvigrisea TaxID=1428644 RepID=A0A1J7BKR4_9ACTN|nr:hypothetical protein BIV57_01350 [Mangrovactinospora gilvigrisea]
MLVAGCSGGGSSGTGLSSSAAKSGGGAAARGGTSNGARAGAQAAATPGAPRAAASPAAVSAAGTGNRVIVYSAEIQLRTKDVRGTADAAEQLAAKAGGYVSDAVVGDFDQVRRPGGAPDASPASSTPLSAPANASGTAAYLVLRVPAGRFDAAYGSLAGLGTVLDQERTADDVTQKVADVGSRVKSYQASIARLRGLLSHAGSVGDLTALESTLTQRESDLESLQQQQTALNAEAAMSTITVDLYQRATHAKPKAHHGASLGGAVGGGWHALTATAHGIALAAAAILPWLVVLVPLALIVLWLRRRGRAVAAARRAAARPRPDGEASNTPEDTAV